jgi:AcrR family transcriptional regulator
MAKRKGANKDNLEQTRRAFLKHGEREFIMYGYMDASTTRIVEASGMARGSLYYHFKDKQDLFRAVYHDVMERTASHLSDTIRTIDDPWEAFIAAAKEYFDVCVEPEKSRIFLIESQVAIPYAERHEVISKTIRPVLTDTLARLCRAGYFDGRHKEMLSMFIFGALGEAGRMIHVLPNREMVMAQFFDTFRWAMEKMR